MFRRRPFTLADDRQARAVDDELKAGAPGNAPQRKVEVLQRIPLGDRVSLDGIAEVFNLFNSPNWTVETQESRRDFGERVAGQNRTAQLGFRLTF